MDETRPLFAAGEADVHFVSNDVFDAPPYDVHPDGQTFLVVRSVSDGETPPGIVVVENWLRGLAERK